MLAVHMGDEERGEAFFARFWPELAAIADPSMELYEAFDLGRARALDLARPRYLVAAARSLLRAGMGRPHGDVMRMPGAFLVQDGELAWSHVCRHFGDHPAPGTIVEQVRAIYRQV